MSFVPNLNGPLSSMGRLTVAAAGTSILFNDNWEPKWDSAPVTAANPCQYAASFADILINPVPTNAGGLFVVTKGGSKTDTYTILLYIPKGTPSPVHLSRSLGPNRFAPEALALDADQDGDAADISGVTS